MPTPKLLLLNLLRRRRHHHRQIPSISPSISSSSSSNSSPLSTPQQFRTSSRIHFLTSKDGVVHSPFPSSSHYNYLSPRLFSTRNSDSSSFFDSDGDFATQPEVSDSGVSSGFDNEGSEISESMIGGVAGEESIFPVPCFLLGVTSIRRMSLDHHSGFDCEGILWFQNLTEFSHGVSGCIFPLLVASLHLANVQVSLSGFSAGNARSLLGLLSKLYKFYLRFLTIPILISGFYIPQGSLVYWVSNSSLTLIQQLALKNPHVREKLGAPDLKVPTKDADEREVAASEMKILEPPEQKRKIIANELSPIELVNLSIQLLSSGQQDGAIQMLRLALDKDPEYVRALVILGQTLLQKGLLVEATEHLESAITKLSLLGQPTEVEDVDLLILSSQWAGSAYARQGKMAEGLVHLERIARLEEPQDAKSKAHYYQGLLFLASALLNDGRKVEAEKYVRMLVAYDPSYSQLFKDLEKDDDFVNELSDTRRRDY